MSLFSSRSKQTTNVDETNVTNVDNRVVDADTANIGGNVSIVGKDLSNVSVTTTDFGALDTAGDISEDAFNFGQSALQGVENVAEKAVKVAESAARDESARTMQFVVLGLTIVGVAFFFRGKISKAFK